MFVFTDPALVIPQHDTEMHVNVKNIFLKSFYIETFISVFITFTTFWTST